MVEIVCDSLLIGVCSCGWSHAWKRWSRTPGQCHYSGQWQGVVENVPAPDESRSPRYVTPTDRVQLSTETFWFDKLLVFSFLIWLGSRVKSIGCHPQSTEFSDEHHRRPSKSGKCHRLASGGQTVHRKQFVLRDAFFSILFGRFMTHVMF